MILNYVSLFLLPYRFVFLISFETLDQPATVSCGVLPIWGALSIGKTKVGDVALVATAFSLVRTRAAAG